jgi:hypothetical protein
MLKMEPFRQRTFALPFCRDPLTGAPSIQLEPAYNLRIEGPVRGRDRLSRDRLSQDRFEHGTRRPAPH